MPARPPAESGNGRVTADPESRTVHSAGLDLVDLARFELAVARCGEPLVRRLFDRTERAAGTDLAGLFGIKESVVKAIGGFPRGACYADIVVDPPPDNGDRAVRLRGELARWADTRQLRMVAGSAGLGTGMTLAWAAAVDRDAPC